jgi:hypothetical protein
MTDQQKKFLELAKYSEQLTEKLSEVNSEMNAVMADLGLNTYHQDPETLLVYKVIEPKGRFTVFSKIDYVRTAKADERSGSLSKKEATELGFVLVK